MALYVCNILGIVSVAKCTFTPLAPELGGMASLFRRELFQRIYHTQLHVGRKSLARILTSIFNTFCEKVAEIIFR
uniref:Putative secreted protein n=1 Tax=Anopheles triannulatus TaxID=58253 RepID=A0A2M4B7N1_9DIPT